MTVGELRELLSRLPDDLPVAVQSAHAHGLCHVGSAIRQSRRPGTPGVLKLEGNVNVMYPAPDVEVRGAWRRADAHEVDVDKARDELLSMLRG